MKQPISFVQTHRFVHSLFFAIALLCAACEGCKQASLEQDWDKAWADLTISDFKKLGQINANNPVIFLSGSISENRIDVPASTYAVVIPTSEDIRKAVESFTACVSKKNNPATATILPQGLGGVYYHGGVQGLQKGEVQTNVYVQGLQPGKYLVYLILYHPKYGAFIGTGSESLEIFAADEAYPSDITMVDVKVGMEISENQPHTHITMQANVDHADGMRGGFLFIKEKEKGNVPKPEELIANYFKECNLIPVASEFIQAFDNKAIIYPFPNNGANTQVELSKIKDTHHLFQRGASYQVYAYLINDGFHPSTNVMVSQNSKQIVISIDVVEMEMKEVNIQAMRKCLNDPIPDIFKGIVGMKIECKVNVTKHDSLATKMEQGYLFLKQQVSEEQGINKTRQLLQSTNRVDNSVVVYEKNQEFLFIENDPDKQLKVNQTGELTNIFTLPRVIFELGETYHVYACVRLDDNEVFISKNEIAMVVSKVDLHITKFRTQKDGLKLVTNLNGDITVQVDFHEPEQANAMTTGHLIYPYAGLTGPKNAPQIPKIQVAIDRVSTSLQERIDAIVRHAFEIAEDLKNNKVKDSKNSTLLSDLDTFVVFIEDLFPGAQSLKSTYDTAFDGVPEGTVFKVAKVWCHGNVVFFKQAEEVEQRFIWLNVDKQNKPFTPITLVDGTPTGYEYRRDETLSQAELRKAKGVNNWKGVELNAINSAEIENLLRNVFKGDDEFVNGRIKQFMNVMKKKPVNP